MIVSQDKRRVTPRAFGLPAVIGLCLSLSVSVSVSVSGAQAQPVSLTPESLKEEDRGDAPAPTAAEPLAPAGTQVLQPGETPVIPGAVQVDGLGVVNSDTVGILGMESGGLPSNLWEGTKRRLVTTLMKDLPVRTESPTMRAVMRRLLLTAADAPESATGAGEDAAPPPAGEFLEMRATLLMEMGEVNALLSLLERLPRDARTDGLAELEAEARLLSSDIPRACGLATEQMSRNDRPYWQRLFVFCQALSGEHEQAALGAGLLREMGAADPMFFLLLNGLKPGGVAEIASLPRPTPLHLAMARAAKATLPEDIVGAEAPALLRAIALGPNAPAALRLEAAERAAATGAVDAEALRQLYTGVEFDEAMVANPLTTAKENGGPMSRALLYATAVKQTIPAAKAEAVSVALKLARDGGRYATTVRAFMPVIADIRPSSDLSWFAPEAARALLFAGEGEAASRWFSILRNMALRDATLEREAAALMPVAKLAGSPEAERWTVAQLPEWWERVKDMEGAKTHAAVIFTVFAAIGEPVPDDAWLEIIEGGGRQPIAMLPAQLWFRVLSASTNGRMGEAILLSMLALGEGGPVGSDPVVLGRVLTALGNVGLVDEVRGLALEAAVQAGP